MDEDSRLAVTLTVGELRALVSGVVERALATRVPRPADREEPLLTADELSARLGVGRRQLYRYVSVGLPKHSVGAHYRFRLSEVLAWFERRDRGEI